MGGRVRVRGYPKTGGRVLAKTNPRRRKSGSGCASGSGGDAAVAAVGYGEVVKREFARESPPAPLDPRPGVRGVSAFVSLYRSGNRLVTEDEALLIFLRGGSGIRGNEEDVSRGAARVLIRPWLIGFRTEKLAGLIRYPETRGNEC